MFLNSCRGQGKTSPGYFTGIWLPTIYPQESADLQVAGCGPGGLMADGLHLCPTPWDNLLCRSYLCIDATAAETGRMCFSASKHTPTPLPRIASDRAPHDEQDFPTQEERGRVNRRVLAVSHHGQRPRLRLAADRRPSARRGRRPWTSRGGGQDERLAARDGNPAARAAVEKGQFGQLLDAV